MRRLENSFWERLHIWSVRVAKQSRSTNQTPPRHTLTHTHTHTHTHAAYISQSIYTSKATLSIGRTARIRWHHSNINSEFLSFSFSFSFFVVIGFVPFLKHNSIASIITPILAANIGTDVRDWNISYHFVEFNSWKWMISPPPCFLGMRLGQWRGGWVGECYHHSIYCRNGLHGHVYLFVCVCVCVFVLVCVILVFLCWWLLLTGMIGIGNGPSSVTASVAFRVRTRTWTSCWPTSQASHFLQREKERQKDRQTDRQRQRQREMPAC